MAPLKRTIYIHVRQYPAFGLVCCLVCGFILLSHGARLVGRQLNRRAERQVCTWISGFYLSGFF